MDVANVSNTYIESGTDSVNPFFFFGGGEVGGTENKVCTLELFEEYFSGPTWIFCKEQIFIHSWVFLSFFH